MISNITCLKIKTRLWQRRKTKKAARAIKKAAQDKTSKVSTLQIATTIQFLRKKQIN
jgi:hypothetical protein